jgi:hypothetical protein
VVRVTISTLSEADAEALARIIAASEDAGRERRAY